MNILFFGLGRIGLPQSLVFANAGHLVYGYDADSNVIANLISGNKPFEEPGMNHLIDKHLGKRFKPIDEWRGVIKDIDVIIFTLGTKAPNALSCLAEEDGDISLIEELLRQIFCEENLKKKILLVFRTTLFLGSTDRLKNYIESKCAKIEGVDFYLSFVPERLVEGQAIADEQNLPKILSAYSEEGLKIVSELFSSVGGRQIKVKSPTTAEFCKLTDNSFRNTMFAFSNEIGMWAAKHGIDVYEVIDAINADYERNSVPQPGFVSGYCLGKDPYIFEYGFNNKVTRRDFQSLWYYGRRVNDHVVTYSVTRVLNGLKAAGKAREKSTVAILGLSFKEDVDDFRMSHAFEIIDLLIKSGIKHIVGFDPYLNKNKYTKIPTLFDTNFNVWSSTLHPSLFKNVDAIIIAHRHRCLRGLQTDFLRDLLMLANKPLYIYDGWNIWRNAEKLDGVRYEALGYNGIGGELL